jgi:hypothetical protein
MKKREIELFWKEFGRLPESGAEARYATLLFNEEILDLYGRSVTKQMTSKPNDVAGNIWIKEDGLYIYGENGWKLFQWSQNS